MKGYLCSIFLTLSTVFFLVELGLGSMILSSIVGDRMAFIALIIVPVSTITVDSRKSHSSVRSRVMLFWAILTCLILAALFICYLIDRMGGSADKLIRGVAYQNVLITLLCLNIPGLLLSMGLISRRKIIQNISLSLTSGLFFLIFLELIGYLIFELDLVIKRPHAFRRFYISADVAKIRPFPAGDLNPIAGRSHLPNGSDKFVNCAGNPIQWTYNSVGANDRQRQVINPNPNKQRIAIVGDSFLEGYMVNTSDRCSSILERKTGLEHLNFAVNGSNPVHYYLMYKGVAKAFSPDVIIVGFLPANDFEILDENYAYKRIDYPQYSPYWQGTYPNYKLQYSLANVNQSIFSGKHTQASLLKVIDSVYASLSIVDKFKADVLTHSSLIRLAEEVNAKKYRDGQFTRYQQFSEDEWHYVEYSFTKLVEEAKGKKVLILSIPTQSDLIALKRGKTNRIDPLLAGFCHQKGINFISLVPSFLKYTGNLDDLYVPCDGHWSLKGESFVANSLMHNPVYCSLAGLL